MKIVAYKLPGGGLHPFYRLKDVYTGITYPNLLTHEQTLSPAVVEAARTYIAMRIKGTVAAQMAVIAPFAVTDMDYIGWSGSHSGRASAKEPAHSAKPETALEVGERRLLDKIEQLQRADASLQERNDQQASIIRAAQRAVRGVS